MTEFADLQVEKILKAHPGSILIADASDPNYPAIWVSDEFTKLTGYKKEDILGKNPRMLQGPETSQATKAIIRSAINRKQSIQIEILNYKKNGEKFWNEVHISPIFDDNGNVLYFMALHYDVTKSREEREKERKTLVDQLLDIKRS